ncbi:hypothetical protein GCM10023350_25820 [Nocardioides endophyticus]|uniref:O-antigen ligase domain-containing protein n=1 Tax=Nocardioides endophyticus TaxID=1353775 RepID=A0ABP8YXJ6_9ACTN
MTTAQVTSRPPFDDPVSAQTQWISLLSIAWLLLGVRVDLVSLGGSSVRLEDVILAGLAARLLPRLPELAKDRVNLLMLLIAAASVMSLGFASGAGRVEAPVGLLYALRPLEYWVVYATLVPAKGRLTVSESRLRRLVYVVVLVQVAAASAQVLGGVSFGFSKFSVERGAGLTAGPYELGAICVIGGLYALGRGNLAIFAVGLLGILLSASRISLVAYLVGATFLVGALLLRRRSTTTVRPGTVGVTLGSMALVVALIASPVMGSITSPLSDRLTSTSILSTWHDSREIASVVPTPHSSMQYFQIAYGSISSIQEGPSADNSSLIRFYRWNLLLFALSAEGAYLLGLGPSFPGPSVDGALLRIFVETGIVGLLLWCVLYVSLFRRSDVAGRSALLATLVGSLVIDLPFAMRVAVLLLVVLAASQRASNLQAGGEVDG